MPKFTPEIILRRRWWILAVLALSLVIIGLDNTVLNVAIPTVQQHFQATASQLQWMVDAYILSYAGLLLVMGALGDKYGRKLTLQAGLLLFAGFSVYAAYSTTAGHLITARALMGIGGALIMPSTLSVLVNVFPRHERGKAIGIWAGMAAIGIPLGPLLGGWLLEHFWWGSIFFVNVPIAIIALIAGWFLVPESRDEKRGRVDYLGAVFSIAGLSSLVYALIEAPSRGWTDNLVITGFVAAIILLAAFIFYERWAQEPMLDMKMFRNPRLSLGSGSIGLAFLAMFGMVFLLMQYFQYVRGYGALSAGVRLLPFALGMMIGASNANRMVKRFGTKKVVAAGMLLITVTLAFLWRYTDINTPYWVIACAIFVVALGMSNTMAPSTDAVMGAVPEEQAGVGSALNDTVRQVGGALGVAILGSVLNTIYSDRMADVVTKLPAAVADAAQNSVGAAIAIGHKAGGMMGQLLVTQADGAFIDGFKTACLIAAIIAFTGIILVLCFMPAREKNEASKENI